jgi:hypothetical protein
MISADAPFGPNVRVNEEVTIPYDAAQYSPSVTVDGNGNIYIVWYDDRNGDFDIYYANSTDGGITFSTSKKVNDDVSGNWQADPCIAVDNTGKIYIAWRDDRNGNPDIYFANSTDGGNTFSANKKVNDDSGSEWQYVPTITVNNAAKIYIAWRDERNGDPDIYFANSTDGGNTFSANKRINDDIGSTIQSKPSVAVDGTDKIYLAWTDSRNNDYDIYFSNSTDGGNTFSANIRINDDISSTNQYQPSIAVDGTGNIYIAWMDERNSDRDIYFVNSTDGGNTFSTNKMVNDDGGSTLQSHPSIAVDNVGNIYISWEDNRNGNYDIYFTNSTDEGNTFSPNKKVNDDGGGAGQHETSIAGDGSDNIYIAWQDGRNGNWDIYFANSSDGGDTFMINKKVNDDVINASQSNPSIAADGTGIVYIAWMDNRNGDNDIYFTTSTDGGNTFSSDKKLNDDVGVAEQRYPSVAVDIAGNIYIVWEDRRNGNWDIYFTNSSDGGNSFSTNKKVNDDGGSAAQYNPTMAVNGIGNIYIAWRDSRSDPNGDIYFANSSDGGNSFSPNVKVNDDGMGLVLQYTPSIAVDGSGNIYIAWGDYRDDAIGDLYFANSTDGGNTFSTNKKVNDDVGSATQGWPSIAVDGTGNIYIAWGDDRNHFNGDIYFTNSADGGNTFSPNKKVNDDFGSASQYYPSLALDGFGNIYIAWQDSRNGDPDIYFATSSDAGNTFSANNKINDDLGSMDQWIPSIALDDSSTVYVVWRDERNGNPDIYFVTTPFRILNVQVINITDTTATITWNSNKPANSTVDYDFFIPYSSTIENNSMGTTHGINLTNLEPGRRYHFRVTSYNSTTNYSISEDFTFTTKFPIYLQPGWNMISIPLNQSDKSFSNVLQNITGEYDAIQWYNIFEQKDPWKHNQVLKSPSLNDLTEIDRFKGLWIHVKDATVLFVDGTAPDIGYINKITLVDGWNFVGYPSLIERAPSFDLPVGVDIIQWFNVTSSLWESWDPGSYSPDNLTLMKPGQGFWVHYTGTPTEWSLTYVT